MGKRRPVKLASIEPPICAGCKLAARLTNGTEIFPHRRDLYAKSFWRCDGCGGYVGCHPGARPVPLGTPADKALRDARSKLHDLKINPIWRSAPETGLYKVENDLEAHKIRASARGRVYAYLAHHMGIEVAQCHVGMFDLEQCRLAWTVLVGKKYPEIRDWYKAKTAEHGNG